MPCVAMSKNPSEKFLDFDPEADDFQYVITQFFLVHRYICGKIVVKILSGVLT